MTRLQDRTAVVTGAGTGIGRAIAQRLSRCGARVALLGLNHTDEDAVEAGLVQEVLPADGFETAALARLEELASRDPNALGTTKGYLREAILARMREQTTKSRSDFVDAWFAPAAQQQIREAVASLTRKR